MYMKQVAMRGVKYFLDVFFNSVAIISQTILAIIHNVSHWVPLSVTRCVNGFQGVYFVFSKHVLNCQCICTWRWTYLCVFLSHFPYTFLICVIFMCNWGTMLDVCYNTLFQSSIIGKVLKNYWMAYILANFIALVITCTTMFWNT